MGEAGGRLQNPTLAIIVFTPEGFDSHLFPQFDQNNQKQQPCGYAVTQTCIIQASNLNIEMTHTNI